MAVSAAPQEIGGGIGGPRRGEVVEGDHVKVERDFGKPPSEGQVIASNDDGTVEVSLVRGGETLRIEEEKVWQDGYAMREL